MIKLVLFIVCVLLFVTYFMGEQDRYNFWLNEITLINGKVVYAIQKNKIENFQDQQDWIYKHGFFKFQAKDVIFENKP